MRFYSADISGFLLVGSMTYIPDLHGMLDVQPELWCVTECCSQFNSHRSGQRTFVVHNSAQGISVNAHGLSQHADLDMHRLQKFGHQHLTDCNWATFCISHNLPPLALIYMRI